MTWANRTRYLKQQLQALGTIIGEVFINALKPALRAMNVFMDGVLKFARTVADALGKIFGWTIKTSGGGSITEDLSDGFDDVGSSADGAGDKVKKLQKQLAGFDKLNNLSSQDKDKSGSGGSGSGASGASGGAETKIKKVDSVFDKYKSKIDDLEGLGTYIGQTLTKEMGKIDWDSIYEKASGFGDGLAEFLNGLFKSDKKGNNVFTGLGHTIAGAINTVLNVADAFANEFDFKQLGSAVSDGVVAALKDIQWDVALSAAKGWGRGVAEALNKFFEPSGGKADGKNGVLASVGEAVGNALNTALEFLNSFGDTFEWDNFGSSLAEGIKKFLTTWDAGLTAETLSKFANGILKAAKKALKQLKDDGAYENLGQKLADFVCGIDWGKITFNMLSFDQELIDSILDIPGDIVEGFISGLVSKLFGKNAKIELPESFKKKLADAILALLPGGGIYLKVILTLGKVGGILSAKLAEIRKYLADHPVRLSVIIGALLSPIIVGVAAAKKYLANHPLTLKVIVGSILIGLMKSLAVAKKWWKQQSLSFPKIKLPHFKIYYDKEALSAPLWKAVGYPGSPTFGVEFYKAGGFPSRATYFAAGEDGVPEMLGTVGGKTAVAGGSEITGIRDSIESTNMQQMRLLQQQNELLYGILQKCGITDSAIFDSARKSARDYERRTGSPAFS